MPIYAYKCDSCGHAQDLLQKLSDAPLTECSACGQSTMVKQLTAAGFQLKGTGWYATDFKSAPTASPESTPNPKAADSAATAATATATTATAATAATSTTTATAATSTTSASGCGASCACH